MTTTDGLALALRFLTREMNEDVSLKIVDMATPVYRDYTELHRAFLADLEFNLYWEVGMMYQHSDRHNDYLDIWDEQWHQSRPEAL